MARRIRRGMTPNDAIKSLSAGNRNAEQVCWDLYNCAPRIDPDDMAEGWGPLRDLDSLCIWGSRIWLFYQRCGENPGIMLAVLRGWHLGLDIVTQDEIERAIVNPEGSLDLERIVRAVQRELPAFNPAA